MKVFAEILKTAVGKLGISMLNELGTIVESRGVFLKRQSVVTEKEKHSFNTLCKNYMTEESDGSDGELILHKHAWRSEKVNRWMKELDQRHSVKVAGKSITPCKRRVEGTPADSLPPKDAPEWAVDPNWSKEGVNSEAENDDLETEFDFEEGNI